MTRTLLLVLFVALLFAAVSPAQAHTRVEVGPYVLIIGWEEEPVVVGERNAVFLEVLDADGEPVSGVEAGLDMAVLYAGRAYRANLAPTGTAGHYTAELLPTVRGQYQVHLTGHIGETAVDTTLEPEEVLPAQVIQFPEPQPDPLEMEQEVAVLQDRLQTATLLAAGGLVAGLAGLVLGFVAFRR